MALLFKIPVLIKYLNAGSLKELAVGWGPTLLWREDTSLLPVSLIAWRSITRSLKELAVGGGSALLWREDASLPAFTGITSLRLARRNHLQVIHERHFRFQSTLTL